MNKEDVRYTYIYAIVRIDISTMEYYLAIQKNEILPFATTWMDQEGIMLSEISQTEKEKYCMLSLVCGTLKKKQTSEYDKTETGLQL